MCVSITNKTGGPLLLDKPDGTSVQVGISSFFRISLGLCGVSNFPDGFARVSAQIGWIRENACEIVGDLCPTVSPSVSPSKSKAAKSKSKSMKTDSKADKTPKNPTATGQQSDSASQIMPFPYSELSEGSLSMSMW